MLYYVNTKEIPLTEKYKLILKENLSSDNSFIRTQVFRAISIYDNIELLNDFIKINWSGLNADANDYELFYGSLLWLLSAKSNLVDEETAVAHINPNIYGNASEYLSIIGLRKIALSIDSIFKVIANTNIDFPDLEIIENLSLKRNITSLFSVDRRRENVNFEQHLKSLAESGEDFEKRQKNQNQQFEDYINYLKTRDVDFISNGMLPEAFAHIANSVPELKDEWFITFFHLPSIYVPKFHNFILLLAYTYSDNDAQKAQLLWDKISNSESYTNITIGQEKIPLKQMSIWGSSNRDLDAYRFELLDKALSDQQIYNHVLAAIVNNNEKIIYEYINQKINCVEPSQIARGILVAGCLDENSLSADIFDKYINYNGIIGEAYKASLYMYERNIWSKYWFNKMLSTEDGLEFWRYMILFVKIVDLRFYKWKSSLLNNNLLFRKFYHSFRNDINHRCKKWKKERDKKLFGNEPPNPIYIYLQG